MTRFILKQSLIVLLLAVLLWPTATRAQEKSSSTPRPYLGARLSSEIPSLLRKHLQLPDEQGLLIENVYRESPADNAGLDKDDILLSINAEPIQNPHSLFRIIREIGIGNSAVIELIQRGQHKEVTITFEAVEPRFRFDWTGWKYPIEPDESMVIRPGRMFRMPPGQREWIEIPPEQFKDTEAGPPSIAAQYHFLHDDGQQEFTVIIEGNPDEPNASVMVKAPEKEYFTTIEQIDKLPSQYQQAVRNDIKKAKQSYERGRNLRFPPPFDFSQWQQSFADGTRPPRPDQRGPEPSGTDMRRSDSRGPESYSQDDAQSPEQRLEHQLEFLTRQIELMQERQKALEAMLDEKSE